MQASGYLKRRAMLQHNYWKKQQKNFTSVWLLVYFVSSLYCYIIAMKLCYYQLLDFRQGVRENLMKGQGVRVHTKVKNHWFTYFGKYTTCLIWDKLLTSTYQLECSTMLLYINLIIQVLPLPHVRLKAENSNNNFNIKFFYVVIITCVLSKLFCLTSLTYLFQALGET